MLGHNVALIFLSLDSVAHLRHIAPLLMNMDTIRPRHAKLEVLGWDLTSTEVPGAGQDKNKDCDSRGLAVRVHMLGGNLRPPGKKEQTATTMPHNKNIFDNGDNAIDGQ